MTKSEARNAMQKAFIAAWASATPIALDNQNLKLSSSVTKWVRLSIQFNDGEQAAIGGETGNKLFRYYGFVFVQVFTRLGTATDDNDELAEDALKVFEGKEIESIWFRNGRVNTIGESEEKWYQQNVVIEFTFDDIH